MSRNTTNIKEAVLPPRERKLPPFTTLVPDTNSIYDHLPYTKDLELCTREAIKLVTGNIIKYYTFTIKAPVVIDANELAAAKIAERKAALHKRLKRLAESASLQQSELPPVSSVPPSETAVSEAAAVPEQSVQPEKPQKKTAPKSAQKLTGGSPVSAFADFPDVEEDYSFLK